MMVTINIWNNLNRTSDNDGTSDNDEIKISIDKLVFQGVMGDVRGYGSRQGDQYTNHVESLIEHPLTQVGTGS